MNELRKAEIKERIKFKRLYIFSLDDKYPCRFWNGCEDELEEYTMEYNKMEEEFAALEAELIMLDGSDKNE